jgi:hypothetical protein
VPTISGMQAMFQYDRNPLLVGAGDSIVRLWQRYRP